MVYYFNGIGVILASKRSTKVLVNELLNLNCWQSIMKPASLLCKEGFQILSNKIKSDKQL